MKNFLFIILAAVVGGLVALGGAQYLGLNEQVKYVEVAPQPTTNYANFAEPSTTVNVNPAPISGFATAAEKALPAVVHIKASKKAGGGSVRGGFDPSEIPESLRDLFSNPGQGGGQRGEAPLQQGSGSGVIISADGYIVTNNHVVDGAEELQIVLNDQRTYEAEVVGVDPTTDIALIKIKEVNLPTVQFADSDKLKVGEWVVAVGNPFSLTSTVTAGIVSAKGRSIDIVRRSGGDMAIESFIQTDAVVNPGNSGGALVDINGDLVGINTAISSPTGVFAGYSFAVPSAIVKKVVEDLREFGVVQRGLLGARIIELNTARAEELGIDRDNGVLVSEVTEESAAEEAGLKNGDVITGVDGVVTLRNSELLEQLGRHRPGDVVEITFERDGQERTATARLRNASGTTDVVRPEPKPTAVAELGAEFVELDRATAEELNISGGVTVADINSGILSEQTRIRPGFVITKVDNRIVRNAADFQESIKNAEGAVSLEGIYPSDPERIVRFAIVK
ncbi:MAG: serine protease Do [Neolewinella sp.]|jgi:Do/DeqQ family serine protease